MECRLEGAAEDGHVFVEGECVHATEHVTDMMNKWHMQSQARSLLVVVVVLLLLLLLLGGWISNAKLEFQECTATWHNQDQPTYVPRQPMDVQLSLGHNDVRRIHRHGKHQARKRMYNHNHLYQQPCLSGMPTRHGP
ncbi:hypothetical protein ACJQWK_09707 [Exserohilum turcicum]